MFLMIFAGAIVTLIVVISVYLIWRDRHTADFQGHLDPRDQPGGAHSDAMSQSLSTAPSRMGGGAFGP